MRCGGYQDGYDVRTNWLGASNSRIYSLEHARGQDLKAIMGIGESWPPFLLPIGAAMQPSSVSAPLSLPTALAYSLNYVYNSPTATACYFAYSAYSLSQYIS